ncbi:MAG: outer membrane protein assembly factor BamA [Gammaproteobacteria bacterium]|nr:outer membrane protein assembly factor BamA [Gammaproteobacteria bacterium]
MASALEPFVIDDIRVEGLQRISVGTVYNYLTLEKGETLDSERASAAVRALFKTGFFQDVVLEREGNILVVFVAERPAIASVEIEGNSDIPTDQLQANLKLIGLSEGKVFNRSMLDKIKTELQRQYLALGKYNAQVRTEVIRRERNRVDLRIVIAEGEVAAIHHLNIIGNEVFEEQELLDKFILSSNGGWFGGDDQYSKQKLSGDLATLREHYLDNGYVNFRVNSTQVTITPDKRHVYITINLSEGKQYRVSEVTITGDTVVPKEELQALIALHPGEIFSRKKLTESSKSITDALGNNGYAFANINPVPSLDEEKQEVALNYYIDPGKRVYVRRITISGNKQTEDKVLRREMRQMEGGWIASTKVERSRTRLNRLGFFDEVKVATPTVPGTTNQVDLDIDVVERESFGSFNFGIGYGDEQGFTMNTSVDWENFMGSGQRFSINFNNSDVDTEYSIDVTDPYYTMDGVSRNLKIFYRESDSATDTTDYTTDSYGAGLGFGVPVSEYDTVSYRFDYEHTLLHTSTDSSADILTFCADVASELDCEFGIYKLGSSWSRDTRDRAVFPTQGGLLSVGLELAVGGSDLLGDEFLNAPQFYKLRLSKKHYLKLADWVTFAMRGEAAYADVYGDSNELAPYDRYFAGGIRTLRGYESNRLFSTPGTLDEFGLPQGGNFRLLGGAELVIPPPFDLESKSLRFNAFIDAGNVYNTEEGVDLDELRLTYGIAMNWLTPVGPLIFSYGWPINAKDGDRLENFQFSLGMM